MKNGTILITGGAGFIGSHLVDYFINRNNKVIVYDNLISGNSNNLVHHLNNDNLLFVKGDLLSTQKINMVCEEDIDLVVHTAANPDVRSSSTDTKSHFDHNIKATFNLLEAMHKNNLDKIAFTSSSTVYGTPNEMPTPENYGPLKPVSLYGSSKLSCEAIISSYSYMFNIQSWMFRFANVIGERSNHGIIYDFINKLKNNPNKLEILGNGEQAKSYIYIDDCVNAMNYIINHSDELVNIYNIGTEDTVSASKIGEIVCEEMKLENVKFQYTGGSKGWTGDIPKMLLDIENLKSLGWKPSLNSENSIRQTTRGML